MCIRRENCPGGVIKRSLVSSVEREKSVPYIWRYELSEKKNESLSSYRILWISTLMNTIFSSSCNDFLIKAFFCNICEGGNLCFDFMSVFLHHIKWGPEMFSAINFMCVLLLWGTVVIQSPVSHLPVYQQ